MDCLFEPDTGWLRQVRHGDREIINAIYFAFRQSNWATDPANLDPTSLKVECSAGHFDISFRASGPSGAYSVTTKITGDVSGIHYGIVFHPHLAIDSARVGICVLHPPTPDSFSADHGDGEYVYCGNLPTTISPHPPVTEVSRLRVEIGEHKFEMGFESSFSHQATRRFEMEDQRNWGDASFKTYHSPQALGGFSIAGDDILTQSFHLKLPDLGFTAVPEGAVGEPKLSSPYPFPNLGVPCQSPDVAQVHSKGFRTVLARTDGHSIGDINALFGEASRLGLASILFQAGPVSGSTVVELKGGLANLPSTILMDPGFQSGTAGFMAYASWLLGCGIGWLAPSNFTELNRARPWSGSAELVAWSYQPQAHSHDVASILESPRCLPAQYETARVEHGAKSIIFGPYDFKSSPDERVDSIAGAIWLVGVLASFAESAVPVTHSIFSNWASWRDLSADGATAAVLVVAIAAQGLGQSTLPTIGALYACKLGDRVMIATSEPAGGPIAMPASLRGRRAHFFFDPNNRADTTESLGPTIDHTGLWVAIIE